jgi:hypothetical protein
MAQKVEVWLVCLHFVRELIVRKIQILLKIRFCSFTLSGIFDPYTELMTPLLVLQLLCDKLSTSQRCTLFQVKYAF